MSLRDVERAMVVFKFFIEKMSLFKDLIAAKAKDEVRNFIVYVLSLLACSDTISLFLSLHRMTRLLCRMPLHGH